MKLSFTRLDLSNFKSFNGSASLDIAARGPGLIMVRGRNEDEPRLGSNGAGKSSLFGALCWGLYGRTENGLRNPDIRPWNAAPATRVVVRFTVDDEAHEVVRTADPNRLTLDGRKVEQESVDRALGIDYDLFIHTILLGQGQPLFLDLPPREKVELFTTVLNLDVWERRSAEATRRAAADERMRDDERARLAATQSHLQQVDERIAQTQPKVNDFERDRQVKLVQIAAEIEQTNAAIAALQPQIETAMLQVESEAELRLLQKDIAALQRQHADARATGAALRERVRLAEREIIRITAERSAARSAKVCPTCGQPVRRADLSEHLHGLDERMAQNEAIVENTVIPPNGTAANHALDAMLAEAEGMRRRIDAASQVITTHGERLIRLRSDIPHKQREAEQLTAQQNPYRAALEDAKRQRTQLAVVERDTGVRIAGLDRHIARAKFWVKGFKEVRLARTDEVLADLELATNAALVEVGLEGWRVQYVIEEETKAGTLKRGMAVLVSSPSNRNPVRWESWSGGEAQRLRIVCALTLSDVLLSYAGIEAAFEVLDEPTAHLSGNGIRDLTEYLGERAHASGKAIYFVDHRALVESSFDGVVEVAKRGGSRIL